MNGAMFLGRLPLIALLSVCLACNGCSTLKVVPVPATITPQSLPAVKAGDRVNIVLKDGEEKAFRVTAVTTTGIQGKGEAVAYAEIAVLQVREVSVLRTGGAVLGVITAVSVILVAVLLGGALSGDGE